MKLIPKLDQPVSYGTKMTLVPSDTEKGVHYMLDFEHVIPTCSCDAYILGGQRPCKHIRHNTIPLL